uniref:Uncharacterized protein n=1 Tax=Salarias fasciatus TaxID=181472 RepID=A0A672J704_SALFA
MNCPPTKRLRGLNQDVVTAFDDPFGDDEDFTQDDLDEIDIIASQAITSTAVHSGIGSEAGNKAVEPSRLSTRSTSACLIILSVTVSMQPSSEDKSGWVKPLRPKLMSPSCN